MATTRQILDTRGKGILELLTDNQSVMSNLMNPSPTDRGTYTGPTNESVDILYPTANSELGTPVGDNEQYFLREFNLENVDLSTVGSAGETGNGNGVLTDEQHKTNPFGNTAAPVFRNNDSPKSHNQPFVDNNSGYAEDRASFMSNSKRKSLATLYWEMRGAFVSSNNKPYFKAQGQDGEDKTYTNRFGGSEDIDTYDGNFVANTNELFFPPSGQGITISSSNGFVLGQVLGGDTNIINQIIEQGNAITTEWFNDLIEDAGENEFLKSFLQNLQVSILGNGGDDARVSQLYRPGFTRAQQPNDHIAPLTELLQQNLLLPPTTGSLPIENGTDESTFEQLYTNNRVRGTTTGMIDPQRFNKGAIAGTGINDLMEPLKETDGTVVANDGRVSVPFTFEEDDDVYLTQSKKHAGFTSNGRSVQSNPDVMEPAVIDIHKSVGAIDPDAAAASDYRTSAARTVNIGEGQYFPFTFSTLNKKNQRMQMCTLQASIQSLGESYNPTWQAKHFFGRSEQIHTYTFTDRTIDISFVIHADQMRQLQNVYERVLWLAQQCYPDYNNEDRISSGPLIAMRVGDLFQYKAGFIRSLTYDWNFLGAGGKWELTRGTRMPQACSVQMSYQVIHEQVPDRDYNFYGGPAGGLAAGFKNVKEIDYGANTLENTEIGQATINGERYIPTAELLQDAAGRLGRTFTDIEGEATLNEIGYLDHVDAANEATTDSSRIPFAGALDPITSEQVAEDRPPST